MKAKSRYNPTFMSTCYLNNIVTQTTTSANTKENIYWHCTVHCIVQLTILTMAITHKCNYANPHTIVNVTFLVFLNILKYLN